MTGLARLADAVDQVLPLPQAGRRSVDPELLAHERVEPLLAQDGRHEIDVRDVRRGDDGADLDVGEERDLVLDVLPELLVRAADDHVGMDTDAAQLVDGVLRRLRLQLAGCLDERDERAVEVEHVLRADLAPELPDRLEERQRLDVADRAADLGDDDVGRRRLRGALDPRLDLVRDVRDHLHGRAEELALALLAQHRLPDRAGAVAGVPRHVLVDEPLVVADVEVGLGAVLGDEDLAVLERAHRAGVDVQVRVELLRLDPQPARLQEPAERGRHDPLPERGDDAAGDEDVLGLRLVGGAHALLPPPGVELSKHGRPLDQLAERTSLAEDGEARERGDRAPTLPLREPAHGP